MATSKSSSHKVHTSTGDHSVLRMANAIRRTRHKTGPLKGKFKTVHIKHAHSKHAPTPHAMKSIVHHAKSGKAHPGKAHKSGKAHPGKAHKTGKAHAGKAHAGKAARKTGKAARKTGKAAHKTGKAAHKTTRSRSRRPRKSSAVDSSMMPTLLATMPKRGNRPMMVAAAVLFIVVVVVVVVVLTKPGDDTLAPKAPGDGSGSPATAGNSSSLLRTVGAVLIAGTVALLFLAFFNRTRIRMFVENLRGDRGDLFREASSAKNEIFDGTADKDRKAEASDVLDMILKSPMSDEQKSVAIKFVRQAIRNPASFVTSMEGNPDLSTFYSAASENLKDRRLVQTTPLAEFWQLPITDTSDQQAREFLEKAFKDSPRKDRIVRSFMNQRVNIQQSLLTSAGLKVSVVFDRDIRPDASKIIAPLRNQKGMVDALEKGGNAFFRGVGGTGKSATVRSYVERKNAERLDQGLTPNWRMVELTRSSIAEMADGDTAEKFGQFLRALTERARLDGLRGDHTVIFLDEADSILNDKVLGPVFKQYMETMPKNVQLVGAANKKIEDKAQLQRFGTDVEVEAASSRDLANSLQDKLNDDIPLNVKINSENLRTQIELARDAITAQYRGVQGKATEISNRTVTDLLTAIQDIRRNSKKTALEEIEVEFFSNPKSKQIDVREREGK